MQTWLRHRWILNLALVALVGTLMILIWRQPGRPPAPEPMSATIARDIQRILIRQPRLPNIEFVRDPDRWKMVKPVRARVNVRVLDQLLRLPSAPVLAVPAAGSSLAGYGLDPPRARVTMNGLKIDIGSLHPIKGQIYVRSAGRVVLVPATHAAPSAYPWNRYVDHRLLAPAEILHALQLPGFRLRRLNGDWQRQPVDRSLSSDRINGFVKEWQHATALAVDRLSRKPAGGRIVLELTGGSRPRRLVLEIVSRHPEFVLRRRDEGLEYHFPEDIGKRLTTLGTTP